MDLLWFHPGRQLSSTQLLTLSLAVGWAELWEPVGRDKAGLLGKAKAAPTSKAKQGVHLLLPTGRQVLATSRKAGLVTSKGYLGRQTASLQKSLPPPSFLPAFIAEHGTPWHGASL